MSVRASNAAKIFFIKLCTSINYYFILYLIFNGKSLVNHLPNLVPYIRCKRGLVSDFIKKILLNYYYIVNKVG